MVELVGGFLFGSLALIADAVHLTSDVLALGLALGALALAQRPPTERHTYGFERAEVLAAQANGVLLLAGAVVIVVEAVRRLGSPQHVDAAGVLVIGVAGVVVNVVSALALARTAHGNLNMRAALWHLALDALGSLAVVVSAVGALVFGAERLDPIASLVIAGARGRGRVERAARRDPGAARGGAERRRRRGGAMRRSSSRPASRRCTTCTSGRSARSRPALSAHVVLTGPLSLHDAQERATELKAMLAEQFGIEHATLEVECHACVDDPVHTGATRVAPSASRPPRALRASHARCRRDRRGTERSRRRQPARRPRLERDRARGGSRAGRRGAFGRAHRARIRQRLVQRLLPVRVRVARDHQLASRGVRIALVPGAARARASRRRRNVPGAVDRSRRDRGVARRVPSRRR